MDLPNCDRCGRFVKPRGPGVSWCQTYTHLDLNDPTYRCSPCTDKHGVKPTNCNERMMPYHGRNPPPEREGQSGEGYRTMTRDEIKAFMEAATVLEYHLGYLRHRRAVKAIAALTEMREIVGQQLPGGYAGDCPHCEEPKGEDELTDCGDERICGECVAAWNESAKARP